METFFKEIGNSLRFFFVRLQNRAFHNEWWILSS